MSIEIYKDFSFDSAHFLPNVPDGHKCGRLHGHTYKVRIHLKGELCIKLGWLVDFSKIKEAFNPLLKILDHSLLNEIKGLENPTCEILAVWIWDKLKPSLDELHRVDVKENPTSGCSYSGVNPNPSKGDILKESNPSKGELLRALPGKTLADKAELIGSTQSGLSHWKRTKADPIGALLINCFLELSDADRKAFLDGGLRGDQ